MELAEAEVTESLLGVCGTSRVATFPTAALVLLPHVFSEVTAAYPHLRPEIAQIDPDNALVALAARDFDLVLGEEYPGVPCPSLESIEIKELFHDAMRPLVHERKLHRCRSSLFVGACEGFGGEFGSILSALRIFSVLSQVEKVARGITSVGVVYQRLRGDLDLRGHAVSSVGRAVSVGIDTDRDQRMDVDDPIALADLLRERVHPEEGVRPLVQGPVAEDRDLFVQVPGHRRDLALLQRRGGSCNSSSAGRTPLFSRRSHTDRQGDGVHGAGQRPTLR